MFAEPSLADKALDTSQGLRRPARGVPPSPGEWPALRILAVALRPDVAVGALLRAASADRAAGSGVRSHNRDDVLRSGACWSEASQQASGRTSVTLAIACKQRPRARGAGTSALSPKESPVRQRPDRESGREGRCALSAPSMTETSTARTPVAK